MQLFKAYIIILIGLIVSSQMGDFTNQNKLSKDILLGKVSPKSDSSFIQVPDSYLLYSKTIYLRKEAFQAYKKMYEAAAKKNIQLKLISGFRSFWHQKRIWEAKWTGKRKVNGTDLSKLNITDAEKARRILQYSSMPGTSRHHWGTDIDIISLNNSYFIAGKGKMAYAWLEKNASSFGFCQTYTPKDSLRPQGYEEEKWHWTYLPLASNYLKVYQREIKYSDISGFKGAESALTLKVIENYVISINQECK